MCINLFLILLPAHTEVQLLVGQILTNFATCDESRPFLLEHSGLLDVMVETVGMTQLREAVRTSALKVLLELGRADKRVILKRVGEQVNCHQHQFTDSLYVHFPNQKLAILEPVHVPT